jgi:hypothetical protein
MPIALDSTSMCTRWLASSKNESHLAPSSTAPKSVVAREIMTGSGSGSTHVPHEPSMKVAPTREVSARGHGPGREKQGLVACDERELPPMAIHRLTVRRRIAKAQKAFPTAFRGSNARVQRSQNCLFCCSLAWTQTLLTPTCLESYALRTHCSHHGGRFSFRSIATYRGSDRSDPSTKSVLIAVSPPSCWR